VGVSGECSSTIEENYIVRVTILDVAIKLLMKLTTTMKVTRKDCVYIPLFLAYEPDKTGQKVLPWEIKNDHERMI
jgi:hypothetical protein